MIFSSSYKSNIHKVSLHSFITGLRTFLPIIFVYFSDLGFSYLEIGTLFSIQAASTLFFEVPAGTFADRFGSKWSIIMSSFIFIFVFAAIPFVSSFLIMTCIFVMWGCAKAFYSGSDTTLIIESLKIEGSLLDTSRFLGRKWACFYYGLAFGGLLCPFLLAVDVKYTFFVPSFLNFVAVLILLTVRQPPLDKTEISGIHHVKTSRQYLKFLNDGIRMLLEHRTLKYLILFTILFTASSLAYFQYIQRIFEDAGVARENFGYLYAMFTIVAAVFSQKAHSIDHWLGEKRTIYLLLFVTALSLFGTSVFSTYPWVFIPILIMQVQAGIYIPIMNHYLNRHIESHNRATLNSMKSFSGGMLMMITSPFVGFLADTFNYKFALSMLGVTVVLIAVLPVLRISQRVSRKVPISK